MIVFPAENLYVTPRPLFERGVRRHLVGEVAAPNEVAARVRGHAFVFEPERARFARRPELRTRIVALGDGPDGTLVMTAGRHFAMDLHESLPR
jgi:hypothetical protein